MLASGTRACARLPYRKGSRVVRIGREKHLRYDELNCQPRTVARGTESLDKILIPAAFACKFGMGLRSRSEVFDLEAEWLEMNACHMAANRCYDAEELGIDVSDLFERMHGVNESPVNLRDRTDVWLRMVEGKECSLKIGLQRRDLARERNAAFR